MPKRVSTCKFQVRVSMWLTLFCRAGQNPASEGCSCDGPEAAARTERAALDPGSGVSPLSFFPLSQEIFQPWAPPGLRFPHVLCSRASRRLQAKFAEDNEAFHHLQGQEMEPPLPRTVKGFPPFRLSSHDRSLVHGAQSLGLKGEEWLQVYGRRGFCHRFPA